MILSREVESEIESHFYFYAEEKRRADEIERDIAESLGSSLDMSSRGGVPDPTAVKAARIEKEVVPLIKWITVVASSLRHFAPTPKAEYIERVYFKGESPVKVQREMYIGVSTFYEWRKEIIAYAAMKACEAGVLSV